MMNGKLQHRDYFSRCFVNKNNTRRLMRYVIADVTISSLYGFIKRVSGAINTYPK